MRSFPGLALVFALTLTGCGSSDSTAPSVPPTTPSAGFNPPPAAEGYRRLVAATIPDIQPGGDVTYCQYVMPSFDHDVDIIDLTGHQSHYGHHVVAFSFVDDGTQEIGSSFPCMGTEVSSGVGNATSPGFSVGSYLGGIAGETDTSKSGSPLPEGVAFRLKKGNGIMLNIHFLNTGNQAVDGDAVIDVKFADPDPSRLIASMFVNVDMTFDLAPSAQTDSSAGCVAESDAKIIMAANHMHEYGIAASSEVQRAGAATFESLHDDPTWSYDMQFNIQYSRWSATEPYVLHAGDTIRTNCSWRNTTSTSMTFPREMCVGLMFVLVTGDNPRAPGCVNGTWMPELL
jgi:hypothetical protein